MNWERTNDPNLIVAGPYYIRRCTTARGVRYLLGRGQECLGGFDTADEAKWEAEVRSEDREQQGA